MSHADLEIIYKYKTYFKNRYRKTVTLETFNDLFHDAMETYMEKLKVISIQYPKSYFGWILKGKISNFKANRKAKKTDYVEFYPEIAVEEQKFVSYDNILKDVNNVIQQLPKQQKFMAQEYLINENAICEIAEKHNMKYMTTKANVRHMLTVVKKKLKHLKSQNDNNEY